MLPCRRSQGLTGSARAGAVRQSEARGLVTAPATRRTMIGSGPRCTSSCEEDGVTLYTAAGGLGEQGQCHTLHAPVVWSVLLLRLAAVSAPAAPRAWSLIVFYSATKASQRVCLLAQRPPARPMGQTPQTWCANKPPLLASGQGLTSEALKARHDALKSKYVCAGRASTPQAGEPPSARGGWRRLGSGFESGAARALALSRAQRSRVHIGGQAARARKAARQEPGCRRAGLGEPWRLDALSARCLGTSLRQTKRALSWTRPTRLSEALARRERERLGNHSEASSRSGLGGRALH